jgi:hypothetical protein
MYVITGHFNRRKKTHYAVHSAQIVGWEDIITKSSSTKSHLLKTRNKREKTQFSFRPLFSSDLGETKQLS